MQDRRDAIPVCPRCGYDLSGEADRWETSCPVEGRCPECGLDFAWRSVFRPEVPAWSVEAAHRGVWRGFVPTLRKSFRPGRFWAELEMGGFPRWGRVVAFAMLGMILAVVVAGVPEGFIEWQMRRSFYRPASTSGVSMMDTLEVFACASVSPFGVIEWSIGNMYGRVFYVNKQFLLAPMFVVLCPAAYLVLPVTLRRCKVRRGHLVRAFLYGLPRAMIWLEVLYLSHLVLFWQFYRRGLGGLGPVWDVLIPFAEGGRSGSWCCCTRSGAGGRR